MEVVVCPVPAVNTIVPRPKRVCHGNDCESRFYSIRAQFERSKLEREITVELDDETRQKVLKRKWRMVKSKYGF